MQTGIVQKRNQKEACKKLLNSIYCQGHANVDHNKTPKYSHEIGRKNVNLTIPGVCEQLQISDAAGE